MRLPAADLLFDFVQSPDPLQGLQRDRRGMRDMDVVELAPHVRPASRLLDLLAVELIEAGIGIGLQHTSEGGQVRSRSLTFAIRAVAEEHRRRIDTPRRPIIAHVRP
jgi:hypothetical protein